MHSRQPTYSISYTGSTSTLSSDISNTINSIYNADDYLHYTSKGYSYSYTVSGGVATINFTFNYWNTAAQDSFVSTKVNEVLAQIITAGMNDFEKERAIHDWIEKNVAYDTTLVKHSDYDAVAYPYKTVCQGYALLSYKMLNQAGIQTKIVEGTAGGQAHAWNLVYLDGAWYHFDSTWDDPLPDVAGRVTYDYYNLTDAQIKLNHSWVKAYPTANTDFANTLNAKLTSDSSNSSVYQGLIAALELNLLAPEYTVSNSTELNAKIQEAIKNNQTKIRVRYISGSTIATDIATAIKGISNITSYSYSKVDYNRSSITGDIRLDLSFTYFTPVSVTSVALSNTDLTLAAGASSTLTATILPINASNKTVIWSTSNPSVATVLGGIVKAVGGGTAIITAKTSDGNYTATCNIKVIQGVSSITLTSASPYVRLGGDDITLTANIIPTGATDKSLTWTSSNPIVATVDSTGKVHAVSYGSAVISSTSVQDPTKVGRFTVTVPVPVTGVTVTSTSTVVKIGSTLTLGTTIAPSTATIKTVTWSSSNEAIAKVSSTGVVTPVATGTVTITAKTTDGGFTGTKDLTVIYGVTGITLDKASAYVRLGESDLTLVPTVNPSNATDKSLTWTSSNSSIATVDSNGTVHAVAYGSVTITATSVQDPTKVARCTVIVPVPVTGVTVTSSSTVVKMGSTLTLGTTIAPSTATIKTVTWSSSNEAIAKVSSTGVVTPIATGTVTITAKTTDGGFTGTKDLTVIYGVTGITLDKTSAYVRLGESDLTLVPTVNPSNATDKSLTWTSSNPNIATVDSNGTVHAVAYGSVTITATSVQDPTKVARCTVIVPVPVTGVTVTSSSTVVKMGSTLTLGTTIAPTTATIKTVTWSSSNEAIAKVSTTGLVTPVAPGTVTITAKTTDGGFTGTKDLTVIYGVTGITLDKTSTYLRLGDSDLTLVPTVNPSNATDKSLTWTSSNSSIATVDSNGTVHAVAYGSVTITATSVQDPTKVARCTVIVPVPATGVTVTSGSTVVKMGSTLTLGTTIAPSTATIKTVTWSSSNEAIAKVSITGVVTPVATGTVTITAKTTDGGFTGTKDLTVIYGVTGITLDKASAYVRLGESDLTLVPTVNPSNATDKSLTWTSSNSSIATVDSNGTVHAVAYGSVTITATSVQDPTKVARCTVIVPVPATGVTVTSGSTVVKMGSPLTLGTTIAPSTATIKTVTWSSSNEAIAKVSSTGVVTPVATGTVTITAKTTDGGFTATKDLTVIYGVTSITLDKTTVSLKLNSADITLIATINPTNATDKSVKWTTSNSAVVTVDSNGNLHAVGLGTATITVTSVQDPTKVARCTVTVMN
nr:Ig-like domain-containing protein [Clostridium yunnanense]